ncbi:FAD/NAD(P)-binding oxidoreductase [Rhodovulum sp. YEN HP10]|uniref:NAD(P)/FAD-dependent oxidoreductase n=1 Tax=Rhodovulum sp. HP10 TaxID=3387397 RepID=UPI0039E12E55
MHEVDLAVVGAGPAGMAAAGEAAQAGLRVALFDAQTRPGGLVYRDIYHEEQEWEAALDAAALEGRSLIAGLDQPGIKLVGGAEVLSVEPGFRLTYRQDAVARTLRARRVLLATGGHERPMPVPGWTLSGVLTVGAGQILLKEAGLLPRRAVLLGTGPLLYLFAVQMLHAGVTPTALIDTQTRGDLARAMCHLGGVFGGWPHLSEGWRMLRMLRRAGVPRITAAHDVVIEGEERAEAVRFQRRGAQHRLPCDAVFLHHGVEPNLQVSCALGLAHRWMPREHCFTPVCDIWGEAAATEAGLAGVFVAGDGAGIVGARAAGLQGRLAALRVAESLGRIDTGARDALAAPLRRQLRRALAVRPFLGAAYPPFAEACGHERDATGPALGPALSRPPLGMVLPGGVPGGLAELAGSGGEAVANGAGALSPGALGDGSPDAPEAEKIATGPTCHAGRS